MLKDVLLLDENRPKVMPEPFEMRDLLKEDAIKDLFVFMMTYSHRNSNLKIFHIQVRENDTGANVEITLRNMHNINLYICI